MSNLYLSQLVIEDIIDIIASQSSTVVERESLLAKLSGKHRSYVLENLDITGSSKDFASHLVKIILQHPSSYVSATVLSEILQIIKQKLGVNFDPKIDYLTKLLKDIFIDLERSASPHSAPCSGLPSPKTSGVLGREVFSIREPIVRFLAYFGTKAIVNKKSGMYIYAYTAQTKADVERDIRRYIDEMGGTIPTPRESNQTKRLKIGTYIKVVPECDDLELEPQSITKRWKADWTRFEFEFTPRANLVNNILFVRVSIRIEEIEIAHIKCAIEVIASEETEFVDVTALSAMPRRGDMFLKSALPSNPLAAAKFQVVATTPYRHIFISYSRLDSRIARAFKTVQAALDHDVFLDIDNIRSGEDWRAALARAIDKADIFQLFWSEHSAASEYCKYEWSYALEYRAKGKKEGFIRPVYWKKPMPSPPQELADLNFTYCEFEKQNPIVAALKAVLEHINSLWKHVNT